MTKQFQQNYVLVNVCNLQSAEPLIIMSLFQAHGTAVVPPIMLMLAKMPEVANYDLSSLRLIIVGAAPLGELIN